MDVVYQFEEVARLPLPGDNCAVAIRQLNSGTVIQYESQSIVLDYTVMEGHRFAVKAIAAWRRAAFVAIAFRRGA